MAKGTQGKLTILFVLFTLLGGATWSTIAQAQSRYFHIRVVEYDDEERMSINFPLSMVRGFLPLIEREHISKRGNIEVDGWDVHFDDLLYLVQGLRETKDGDFLTIRTDDFDVEAGKEGEYLIVRSKPQRRRHADFDARIPLSVLYAAVSEEDRRLDLRAALDALSTEDEGELISLRDGEVKLSVWIDTKSD